VSHLYAPSRDIINHLAFSANYLDVPLSREQQREAIGLVGEYLNIDDWQ